ncbi:MAG: 50S ribosomal protein L25/general stress protein Ctc, partial [Acidimicrobiales bacterium]
MPEITLVAKLGRTTGSASSRRSRATGQLPAVIYGHGIDPQVVSVDARELRGALTTPAGTNALISMQVGDT